MTKNEEWYKTTGFKMTFEEFKKCDCQECIRENCIHKNTFRRFPEIEGGAGECYNLK